MKRFGRAFFPAAFLAAAILAASVCGCRDTAAGADAADPWTVLPDDAGVRMLAYVEEFVKNSPRDAGTPGAARASRWIAQEIRRMGLKPVAD